MPMIIVHTVWSIACFPYKTFPRSRPITYIKTLWFFINRNLHCPIYRHQFTYTYSYSYTYKKKHTNFCLLNNSGQFSVVQSTKSSATPLVLCCYHYTKAYSMPVLPICRLCKYYHRQGCSDTQHHIVGSYPHYSLYHTIFHKCLHATY